MKVARDGARCRRFDVPAPLSEDEVKAVADRAEAVAGQRLERVQAGCAWEPALEALAALGNHDLVVRAGGRARGNLMVNPARFNARMTTNQLMTVE